MEFALALAGVEVVAEGADETVAVAVDAFEGLAEQLVGFAVAVGLTEKAGEGVAVGMGIGTGEGVFVSPASLISTTSGVACAVGISTGSFARLLAVANATTARATTITDKTASAVICKGVKFFIYLVLSWFSLSVCQSTPIPIRSLICPNACVSERCCFRPCCRSRTRR